MKMRYMLIISVALMLLGALIGCDIGVNPLLFDGTPVSADYRVDVTGTSYAGDASIPLRDILNSIKGEVDSINVINITILIDNTEGTAPSTTLLGSASVDGYTFVTLSGVPINAFDKERSIFDKTIPNFSFDRSGVEHITSLLHNPYTVPETVPATVSASASSSPLHFTIHFKLYTQIFTKPKK